LSFGLFMNDINISIFYTYILIVISFICLVVNGLDFNSNTKLRKK
jgi:hypothetical protein